MWTHTLIFLGLQFKHARLAGFLAFAVAEGRRCDVGGFSAGDGTIVPASSSSLTSMFTSGVSSSGSLVIIRLLEGEVKNLARYITEAGPLMHQNAGTLASTSGWRGVVPSTVAFSSRIEDLRPFLLQ